MEVRGGEGEANAQTSTLKPLQSRKKEDFSFGKILGEGSFSTVGTIFVILQFFPGLNSLYFFCCWTTIKFYDGSIDLL